MRWSIPLRPIVPTLLLGLALLLAMVGAMPGCVSTQSRPTTPPTHGPDRTEEFRATCTALYHQVLRRAPDPDGLSACLQLARAGKTAEDIRAIFEASEEYQQLIAQPPAPVARRGQVRTDRHVLVDDGGPFLAAGTSLFWALWGELHDVERLEANLKAASEAGYDYIRVLAQVGPDGWSDRTVRPSDAGWQSAIRSLTDRAQRHGLRVQWTIFGTPKALTTQQRRDTVLRFLDAIEGRHHAVAIAEVSNEGFALGPEPAEAKALADLIASRFPGLVAVTAPKDDHCTSQATWYAGSRASLTTLHPDRALGSDGLYRPIRQVWREGAHTCAGVPQAYANNEPIGPQSSVNADSDVTRIVGGAAVSWLAGFGSYVAHTGAGIRGGGIEDGRYGRPANLWQSPNWTPIAEGIRAMRALLPADLPNWQRHNWNWPSNPFEIRGLDFAGIRNSVMSVYTAERNGVAWSIPIWVRADKPAVTYAPKTGTWRFEVYDPATGHRIAEGVTPQGVPWALPRSPSVQIVKAVRQ